MPYRSVVRKFLLLIAPPLVLLMLAFGLMLGSYNQSRESERTELYRQQLKSQLAKMVAQPIHYFEYKMVDTIVHTTLNTGDVSYVHITDEFDNTICLVGDPEVDELLSTQVFFTLPGKPPRETLKVGYIKLGFINENPGFLNSVYLIPIVMTLVSLIVLTTLLYAVWKYVVARPLDTLRLAMENRQGAVQQRVDLKQGDEFGLIATSYNNMLTRLEERSEALREANLELEKLTGYDQLTLLLNQHTFREKVSECLDGSQRYWFLFVDLDRFKWVNDSYGHLVGDAVLQSVARHLQYAIPGALISRFGGDEFVALCSVREYSDPEALARLVRHHVARRIQVDGIVLTPGLSLGMSGYPDDAEDYESLLSKADAAMYHAKRRGRNTAYIFNEPLNQAIKQHNYIVDMLNSCELNDVIYVEFQPIVDSRTGSIISAEALLRINHRRGHPISTGQFLRVAEDAGYQGGIDQVVRRKALSQLAGWYAQGLYLEHLHVNLSAVNFNNFNLARDIMDDLQSFGLPGKCLVLEITETALITEPERAIQQLKILTDLGVRVALDDFGTGHSSLSMLIDFPIHILKLDRSFFRERGDQVQQLVVSHVVALARSLNMQVIAEGVNDEHMIKRLHAIDCSLIQSFRFYMPQKAAALGKLLPVKCA